ncbi:VWA domain-containing protein [Psychromicrobium sp. YIM B11713]|uniref:vWA domain-containing protein n=1 Tax=Psychromicrobium sp. YIM B11713 TaxID=3145233 RepID=UPI00374ED216
MVLILWWLIPLVLLCLAVVAYFALRRPKKAPERLLVAHAERLTSLPGYARALAKRRRWTLVALGSLGVLIVAGVLAAARPAEQSSIRPEQSNRDIVLCLDVSGSMIDTDARLVDVFTQLAKDFHGERLGMVIFDSSAVQVFPLTDDYDFINEQLIDAGNSLQRQSNSSGFFEGTYSGKGSSLIGDGLATCVNSFPKLSSESRSRSIVFATDNVLVGKPLFTLPEAADLASKNNIRIYGINPNGPQASATRLKAGQQMSEAVKGTGGEYYVLGDDDAASDIVAKVQATEASKLQGRPQLVSYDRPEVWLLMAGLGLLGVLFAAWRLRR